MSNFDERHGLNKGVLESPWVGKLAVVFLVLASLFMIGKAANALINFDAISEAPQNVITVSGEGKVSASPNLATISFAVSEDATTASDAQDAAAKKTNAALAVLKDLGIADKDIKTSSYNVYPRYSQSQPCVYYQGANGMMPPCPATEQKIIGYTASQTVDVKVRNLDTTGTVLSKLGSAGVSNIYGPNLTVENPDALQAQARADAIQKARAQANQLASQLGVRIVRLVNYSEGGGAYPMYYKTADAASGRGGMEATPPSIPTGENDITVNVTITYEIR
jgi:uncharacterized protein YggE